MKTYYTYSGCTFTIQRLIGAIFLVFASPVSVLMVIAGTVGVFAQPQKQESLFLLIFGLVGIIGFLIIGLGNLYFFPSITTSVEGIEIPFLFHRIFIPWTDVIDVDTAWFIGDSLRVVKCHKITLFHWVYGVIYGGTSIHPSFLVSSRIDSFHNLMQEIKSHIDHNKVR